MADENKPLPVAGYTTQSDENVALANELKFAEERYLRLLDRLRDANGTTHPERTFDERLLALARTALQEANMWAVRAIFQPKRVALPEDAS